MGKHLVLSVVLLALGVILCFPAIKIFSAIITNNNSDINLSGFNVALLFSTVGGGALVGSAWILVAGRRNR